MHISKPILPPRKGYVERVGADGQHYYASTEETKELLRKRDELSEENTLLKAQIKAQTDRSDFLEDCIAEMAMLVYAE